MSRSKITFGVLLLWVLMSGRLSAQDAEPAAEPAMADPAIEEPVADVATPTAEMSPDEMVKESDRLKKAMQDHLKRVVALQQMARKQKDVIKLNCVNDKLLQIKQLTNIADNSLTNMHEAIAQEDDASRYHEFGRLVISEQQIGALVGEAEACIGEELVFLGPTQVTVEEPEEPMDPDDPPSDGLDGGGLDGGDIEEPSFSSPFS